MKYVIRPLGTWTDPVTPVRRSSGVFKASWRDTLVLLGDEIEKIDGESPVVFQIDVQEGDIRLDGMLRANARVGLPGVVVSFQSKYGPLRYATDAYEQQWGGAMPSWQANIRAIALALGALRAVDRYGVTKRGEQYAGWKAISTANSYFDSPRDARDFLRRLSAEDGTPDPGTDDARLYRTLARRHHPDQAEGSREVWDRLEAAARQLGLTKEVRHG
jgi:hypothetical protein